MIPGGWVAPQATTWLQVSGYRYLMRRMESALLRAEPPALETPPRRPLTWLTLGGVLAVIALAGCAAFALLRPQPGLGDARIAMGRVSGALYVRVADTWHPVLNLASARLIAATDANPQPVAESALAHTKRGPTLGIPGAPPFIAPPLPVSDGVWTICDGGSGVGTTVLIGPAANSSVRRLATDQAILVTPDSGSPTYLLYRGRRAQVDPADRAVLRALKLQSRTPLAVSQSLLNAVPEAPPIVAPRIRGAGGPAGTWLPEFPVGSVLRITQASGDEYYVVLSEGIQRIGQVAADLLRFSDSQGTANVMTVAPDVLRAAPVVDLLPVSDFPDQAPTRPDDIATVCVAWVPAPSGPADIALLTGPPLPAAQRSVVLAQADGRGPAVDSVWIPPDRSAYVTAQNLTGSGARVGTRFLVTDTGVRFAIGADDAAHDLGLPSTPTPAPWPVLAALPCGPELSRSKALVARDTVGP